MLKTVLISVSDKQKLDFLVSGLRRVNPKIKIISSGGTAKKIRELGFDVTDVSEYTGYPEMPDGLVKTLHPMIHGGLLGDISDDDQVSYMEEHGIEPIDLVVCNLYPFEEVVRDGADLEIARRNIDIGGPSMIRSAAKNFGRVCVVTDVDDYEKIIDELKENSGEISKKTRFQMSIKAFERVEYYNRAIKEFMQRVR
ncbi:IMP cyclohydrolase [Candidatus Woesearchaeota archaeon CG11_big_fil_rev_8_21_14_0_20_43_8]|nr:MAG: IMP cyclohydrolase [Candidatus Woesearchaeota archaeon CG11_big_fil_rev_8_21_14_0_20_43_8]PIO05704.1 MAG: IMP cyclohydrolase [Candidatus Woesearchaeota archaeon CG08_land_8_20_14_0_20_43_7]